MKRILKHFLIDTFCLWAVSNMAKGMSFEGEFKTLFLAGASVTMTSFLAKPIINLLLLPLNLITFGLFRWVSSAFVLYIVTLLVKDFKIIFFNFAGFSNAWIEIPPINLQGLLAFIGFSFLLSFISSFIYWLIK